MDLNPILSDKVFSLLIINVSNLSNDIYVGVKLSPLGNLKYSHLKLFTLHKYILFTSMLINITET